MSTHSQYARTIIGPLTTTFTPAPACTVVAEECSTCNAAWQAQTCFSSASGSSTNFGVQDGAECWPPGSGSVTTPIPPFLGWGFYSPGLICPAGSTSACSATAGGASGWPVQFSMVPGETAVGCCPRYELSVKDSHNFTISVLKKTIAVTLAPRLATFLVHKPASPPRLLLRSLS